MWCVNIILNHLIVTVVLIKCQNKFIGDFIPNMTKNDKTFMSAI